MSDITKYGSLRKHQIDALKVADRVAGGLHQGKCTVAAVTPGGGKTRMASLFANRLADEGVLDNALVIVPNISLQSQMIQGFRNPKHGLHRQIDKKGASRQRANPPIFGRCVTYQSLTDRRHAETIAKWVAKNKTLVVFDEAHHMCDGRSWHSITTPLVDAAAQVLLMSGTLIRHDGEKIPHIEYEQHGKYSHAKVHIRYTRQDALRERAILPVQFELIDAEAHYDHQGRRHKYTLSTAPSEEQPRTLKTTLRSSEYYQSFISQGLKHWKRYRAEQFKSSQAIVVCFNQEAARKAARYIRDAFPVGVNVGLSISEDGSKADMIITGFRAGVIDVLVTVKKAYEGLDVPNATHLVYLGDIRSWPFLDQVIARVTRVSDDAIERAGMQWEAQRGYVFTPCDPNIEAYVKSMNEDQDLVFSEKEKGTGESASRPQSSFFPIDAVTGNTRLAVDDHLLNPAEMMGVEDLILEQPRHIDWPLSMQLDYARRLGFVERAQQRLDAAKKPEPK